MNRTGLRMRVAGWTVATALGLGLAACGEEPVVPTFDTTGCQTTFENSGPDNLAVNQEERKGSMYPGAACLGCHGKGGPGVEAEDGGFENLFSAAGTVFLDADGSDYSVGAVVEITDADGQVLTRTTNGVGNFSVETAIAFPARVRVVVGTESASMTTTVSDGDCNRCHACGGAAGGKIFAP